MDYGTIEQQTSTGRYSPCRDGAEPAEAPPLMEFKILLSPITNHTCLDHKNPMQAIKIMYNHI